MKKSPALPLTHWWDWTAVVLLFLLMQTIAMRLISTDWTPSLVLIRGFTTMGIAIGLALGYSTFSRRTARWLSFLYMLVLLPLQWTRIIEGPVALEEKFSSIGGRLLHSFSELFAQRPVEDPLFFIGIMSVCFWVLSASAGFQLTRHQNFLAAIMPSMIGMLVIQNYDNGIRGRIWILAFFILIALFLLGRLNFLQEQKRWKDKRIFLSPESTLDLTGGMTIAAGLILFTAWIVPPSFIEIETARQTWNRITKPWTEFTGRLENAISALESHTGGRSGDFYGAQLELGLGLPLSKAVMFTVEVPDLPIGQKPPRYYWRGRVYDYFSEDRWTSSEPRREEYSPDESLPPEVSELNPASFHFSVGEQSLALLYAPVQAIWVSRPGSRLSASAGEEIDILSWTASPGLLPGETYQVVAVLSNPNIEQLRAAGTEYPQWVNDKYLQLPDDFSPRIRELAVEITAGESTPYDKAEAITRYLRETIEYAGTVPEPPFNADPLEWILFKHKQAYCVYYASAEILMLRSVGVPARMAVGFAQGTDTTTREGFAEQVAEIAVNTYTVQKKNAHAWPEVYFPGIGWVEFEPTGNQDPLQRPVAPRDGGSDSGSTNPNLNPELDADSLRDRALLDGGEFELPATTTPTRSPLVYAIPIFIALAALAMYYLSRRHAIPARLPALVRASIERGGAEAPGWVLNWERWMKLSLIEKAFESVNFALRQVNEPPPIHATPAERAGKLVSLLPELEPNVKILLDEHQTSLYTSRTADAGLARRAAFTVRSQIILARIRHFWTGKYSLRR